ELTADPLEILRSAHIDVPRHSHTCRIRSREGADELLVYGTGGLSVFLCSGRVTAAAQLEEGTVVCRIEAHEQGDGSGGRYFTDLPRQNLFFIQVNELIGSKCLPRQIDDARWFGSARIAVGQFERVRGYVTDYSSCVFSNWLMQSALAKSRSPLLSEQESVLITNTYEGSSITLIQTVDLEKEFTSWGATSRIRGVTFLGTSRVSLLVATTNEGDTEADNKQPFAWAQKTKAPAQWDAVTFRVPGSALDSPSLGPSTATEEALEPGSAAMTSQLCAEVASLRWEMDQMRDTVNKIGADVAAVRR
ncbi:hypothetical protein FOZ63_032681, partial [Perkinsus olseni]